VHRNGHRNENGIPKIIDIQFKEIYIIRQPKKMLNKCLITRSCFDRKLGRSCIAPIATGKASSVSRNDERKREASAGPPPLRGSAVKSFTSCRPCNSLRKSIDNPALSATSSAAETAPFPANLSASPSGSSLHSAST